MGLINRAGASQPAGCETDSQTGANIPLRTLPQKGTALVACSLGRAWALTGLSWGQGNRCHIVCACHHHQPVTINCPMKSPRSVWYLARLLVPRCTRACEE